MIKNEKKLRVMLLCNLSLFLVSSCTHPENSIKCCRYDQNIESYVDAYVYNHLRFLGTKHSEEENAKYDYFTSSCAVIKNEDVIGDNCCVDIVLDSCGFYYKNLTIKNYDKNNRNFCLRFDDLVDNAAFPSNITIRFYVENPMVYFDNNDIDFRKFLVWTPNIDDIKLAKLINYRVEIHMWDGYKGVLEDYNSSKKRENNVPKSFETNWNGEFYVFENSFAPSQSIYNFGPADGTVCSDDSFLFL